MAKRRNRILKWIPRECLRVRLIDLLILPLAVGAFIQSTILMNSQSGTALRSTVRYIEVETSPGQWTIIPARPYNSAKPPASASEEVCSTDEC